MVITNHKKTITKTSRIWKTGDQKYLNGLKKSKDGLEYQQE